MGKNAFSIQPFEAKRVRVESTRSLEEVLLNLKKVVGKTIIPQGSPQEQGSVTTREQFERAIKQEVGQAISRSCSRWTMGTGCRSLASSARSCAGFWVTL